jgi:hypothetical protein
VLSPGRWHEQVPRDPVENRRYRLATLRRASADGPFRQALVAACRDDVLLYVNTFVMQFNPRHNGDEIGPFTTYPFQDDAALEILRCLREQEDVLIEKSRYQGASWLCLIVMDWACLFHGWKKFLAVSHSEQAVDRPGESDSLFWKVQFMHEHLPAWLRGDVRKRKLGFVYGGTHSSMTGAATTERAGVGGRATGVLLDEFSKQRDDYKILGQTADTGPRVFSGTHYGVGGAFHTLTQRPDLRKIVMHWTGHPEMNRGLYRYDADKKRVEYLRYDRPSRSIVPDPAGSEHDPAYEFVADGTPTGGPHPGVRSPWYDRESRRRQNLRDVAMHLDIDPQGSVRQFFDPLQVHKLRVRATPALWEGDLAHDRDSGRPEGLVPREGGPLRLWLHPLEAGGVPRAKYVAGADVAAGTGATPSCLSVARAATGEKVAEYVNPSIGPDKFGVLAAALCRLFSDADGGAAYFCWEHAGPGIKFGQVVLELGMRNVFYRVDDFNLKKTISDRPGWYPTPDGKRLLLEDYRTALVNGQFTNPSDRALAQCLEFRYDARGNPEHPGEAQTEDPSAGRVNHGDLVIADALAWKLAKELGAGTPRGADKPPDAVPVGSLAWRRERAERSRELSEVWG